MKKLILTVFVISSCFFQINAAASEEHAAAKPVIGVNTDLDGDLPEYCRVNSQYLAAIREAGGIPILLPPMPEADLKQLLDGLDGVLMIGGLDYPPSLYHEKTNEKVCLMKSSRSDFDITLAGKLLSMKTMPVLGICAGCQALNIAAGGSLLQDIPSMKPESKIKHASPDGWQSGFNRHAVCLEKNSKLSEMLKESKLEVVSSHHQCVDRAGAGMRVSARSDDGVVEAIEREGARFQIGVQWHPERDFNSNKKLFQEFVRQASAYHAEKSSAAK